MIYTERAEILTYYSRQSKNPQNILPQTSPEETVQDQYGKDYAQMASSLKWEQALRHPTGCGVVGDKAEEKFRP